MIDVIVEQAFGRFFTKQGRDFVPVHFDREPSQRYAGDHPLENHAAGAWV